ncbi:MAG: 50S ribosomal protein L4 [Bacteroidota bacterium]|nr:50S ribosomal protein L4 [Bacteroidota bacterium]
MKVKILNYQGQDTGRTIELKDSIFSIEPNEHAIYLDVKQHLANKRQGTHKTKERADIVGSTKKLRKQKGSGAARIGSVKSPLLRGGGRAFGPRPRDYELKLNKKLKKLARKSAFSAKIQDKEIIVIEDFKFDTPKTKEMLVVKENLKISDKKALFVFDSKNNNVYLSSRNLQDTIVITANDLNTYWILNNKALVLSESTIEQINSILD